MEAFLNLKTKKSGSKANGGAQIKVNAATNLGTFEILKVEAMEPIALRGGVQSVLGIDKQYKTLQQLDLSAFSQILEDQQLYWNLVFWFKFTQLPYIWMAPYLHHIVDTEAPEGPVDQQPFGLESMMTAKANQINPKEFWKPILCELSTKSRVSGEDKQGVIDSSGS